MPETKPSFRVSSALKTIIGKELITNDFIAVFELVKNSFDANATRVDITFMSLNSKSARIVVQDNGNGMDRPDLFNKWLFVAYSAKKEGADYRDKIKSTRVYAGAKGIGRFSCDRLGSNLKVYSRKNASGAPFNILTVNWNDFEVDAKKEFIAVPVEYKTAHSIPYHLRRGTILEIGGLRSSDWTRDKLLGLRRSLERLVNPNQENDVDDFAIYLHVPEEKAADSEAPKTEPWNIVNGRIRNFLFENLRLKTTQIEVRVAADGKELSTKLTDRGTLIYEIREKNPYEKTLKNISIYLFALNHSAKMLFSKSMGLRPVEYGSVFLYKNGFRIHPFGDVHEDKLGINRRKQQGQARFLGTRDLTGRIEINGDNSEFRETSSRDGGLVDNEAFDDLREFFIEFALKRLEAFVVGIIRFGNDGDLLDQEGLSPEETKAHIFDLIARLTKSEQVLDFSYDPDLLNILENRSESSVSSLLKNFKRIAADSNNRVLIIEAAKAEKHLKVLTRAREEAEQEAGVAKEKAKAAEQEAREAAEKARIAEEEARRAREAEAKAEKEHRQTTTQNLFLKSVLSRDLAQVVNLHHYVGISAGTIENHVKDLSRRIQQGKPLLPEVVGVTIERISYEAQKILTIVRFATKANFVMDAVEISADMVEFIREYVLNVCAGTIRTPDDDEISVRFVAPKPAAFVTAFTPIEMSIVMDNLFSNSRKHKARDIVVTVLEATAKELKLSVKDDGVGVPKKNAKRIFEMGFSTTNGSGLGLYHVAEIVRGMNGDIELNTKNENGAEFVLIFRK
ncbi:MAG TPA: ATP-binding protein [Candidatus Sulfotelmatobacter sp.]|nr:ATP-binding protein [Candidatus Sulfotelmatobacter sp.]